MVDTIRRCIRDLRGDRLDDVSRAIDEIRVALRSLTDAQESPTVLIAKRLDAIENRLTDQEGRLQQVQGDALIAAWSDFEERENGRFGGALVGEDCCSTEVLLSSGTSYKPQTDGGPWGSRCSSISRPRRR